MPKAKNGKQRQPKAVISPLTPTKLKEIVKTTNSLISKLKDYAHELEIPSFGSSLYGDYISGPGGFLPDSNTIIASTIADRITGKFEAPDFTAEQRLRRECSEAYITYESTHLSSIRWEDVPRETRGVVYRASDLIYHWLNGSNIRNGKFFYNRSFWHFVKKAPIEFGPGESFISKNGDVSIFSKLDPYNFTVTEDCLEEAALFCSINKGFRVLFSEVFRKERFKTKAKARLSGVKEGRVKNRPLLTNKSDFSKSTSYFASRVVDFLRAHNLVQRGSRGTSVYKNSKKRRFINVECLLNVVMQKVAGWALRQCLKVNAACDLDLGQDYHKKLISNSSMSTVDWTNASDSILKFLVEKLFSSCKKVFSILDKIRSHFVLIDTPVYENLHSHSIKMYHHPKKFSSMGNGFTFELLTIVNLAIARVLDGSASVYGDDVILQSVNAESFISHMSAVGFVPNLKKSFVNLPFRESCGGFFEERVGYIRSYDFKWNYNIADCIVTANKVRRILEGNPSWVHPLRDRMVDIYKDLKSLIPAILSGPIVHSDDIPTWLERENYRHRKMKDTYSTHVWKKYSQVATDMARMHQHTELRELGYDPGDFTVVLIPTLVNKVKIKPQKDVKSMRLAYAYVYSGMVSPMLLRQQKNDYKFGFKPTLVHSEGWSMRVATARMIALKNQRHELLSRLAYAA